MQRANAHAGAASLAGSIVPGPAPDRRRARLPTGKRAPVRAPVRALALRGVDVHQAES